MRCRFCCSVLCVVASWLLRVCLGTTWGLLGLVFVVFLLVFQLCMLLGLCLVLL